MADKENSFEVEDSKRVLTKEDKELLIHIVEKENGGKVNA